MNNKTNTVVIVRNFPTKEDCDEAIPWDLYKKMSDDKKVHTVRAYGSICVPRGIQGDPGITNSGYL